jgi:hypothetical protein
MIWIQFSSASDASPSTTFVGTGVEVVIKVLTDPLVAGIAVKDGVVRCSDDFEEDLVFDAHGVASLSLKKGEHPEGKYEVTATTTKQGYRDAPLSAHFYYLFEKPDVSELDHQV